MLLLAALLLLPTAVSADEPEYTFVLTADGADSCRAAAGDIVTVTLAVRCDSGTDAVYAAQDEIVFDPAFFAFEPDSVLSRSGGKTSTLHLRDGRQAVYMSFISYGSAADWAGETVLGSFRLRVLAEDGTGALCSSNYLVSSQDGMTHFPAGAEDAAVVVSELCRVTFQTNGGGDILFRASVVKNQRKLRVEHFKHIHAVLKVQRKQYLAVRAADKLIFLLELLFELLEPVNFAVADDVAAIALKRLHAAGR